MPYIKELNLHGFKSFARETKIPFRRTMNCVIGPNGSGKSNITDGICFVLGRLGTKSMRASKLINLIFSGTKKYKPATEASVELVFDNLDKGFSLDDKEVSVKRIVRRNGQSIYKINNETKTRQEVVELLAQAGIDSKGFNLVLQGQIENFVKMHPDERRGVIEEVAGISIYEMRKQKSLKELERTDAKLKQISTILRERSAYLRNLENERKQALRFKELTLTVKRCKASILHKNLQEKNKVIDEINEQIDKKQKHADKIKLEIGKAEQEITSLNEKISHITSHIQKNSGLEQDKLNQELSDLRAELAGMEMRKDNFENQISEFSSRKEELKRNIETTEKEIEEAKKSKGNSKKQELDSKKKELDILEEQKRNLYMLKSNLSSINSRIEDKKSQTQKIKNESDFTLKQIESIESELQIKENLDSQETALKNIKHNLIELKEKISSSEKNKLESEKSLAVLEKEIEKNEKNKKQVSDLDTCPLCQTKITKDHVKHVIENENTQIQEAETQTKQTKEKLDNSIKLIQEATEQIEKLEKEKSVREQDTIKLNNINTKKEYLRKLSTNINEIQAESDDLCVRKKTIENKIKPIKVSEERTDSLRLEISELERYEEKHATTEVTIKQRDLERTKIILKQITRDEQESTEGLAEITETFEEKQTIADEKGQQEKRLRDKFKQILEDKTMIQDKIRLFETEILKFQNNKYQIEQEMNNKKIERAQVLAQKEGIEQDSKEFEGTELLRLTLTQLRERLENTKKTLENIGTVNMKALEVYKGVKEEYDRIQEKVDTLEQEKQEILKIIEDIDKKKKKTFLQTLKNINDLFERNFAQLSTKGVATLEASNKEDLFAGGLDIIIKLGKGKYFDITSLSGGEQTLVALSLIFAIQEFRPYCFYIFDEIDAALDKRNSEKLAMLLKKYLKSGQYIIVTHNDALITESSTLYGVSMQEGVSKVLSLEI